MRIDNDPLKKWGAERDGLSRYCGGGKNGLVTGAPRPIKWFADRLIASPANREHLEQLAVADALSPHPSHLQRALSRP